MRGPLSWDHRYLRFVSHAAAWTREIGIRVGMGASAGGVTGMFIRQGLVFTLVAATGGELPAQHATAVDTLEALRSSEGSGTLEPSDDVMRP